MAHDQQRQLIEQYLAAYNAFDIAAMLALLAPQIRFENHAGGQLTASCNGITEFRQLAEQSKGMFSEREQRIISFETSGATFTAGIAYCGRLAVDIPGGPQAGELLELQGSSAFTIDDGKISVIVDRS